MKHNLAVALLAFLLVLTGMPISPISAATDPGASASQRTLDAVDKFLSASSPGYIISKGTGNIAVDFCKKNKSCQDAIPRTKDDFNAIGYRVAVKSGEAGFEQISDVLADPEFIYKSTDKFFKVYGHPPSPEAFSMLRNLTAVGKFAQNLHKALPWIKAGIGVWKMSTHIQSGDYEEATKTALRTATSIGVGIGVGAACTALTAGLGAFACVVAGGVVGGIVGDFAANWAGDQLYGRGKKYIDGAFDYARKDMTECVDKHDGFVERFCSLAPLAKWGVAGVRFAVNPAGAVIDRVTKAVPDGSSSPPNAQVRSGGVQVGVSVNDNSPDVKANNLETHVRVRGDVITVAPSGSNAVTRIGSTGTGTGEVSGTYITDIDGTIYNKGGILEINPIQGCATRRNGQCCIEIHRSHCVISKYKRSKKSFNCADGYDRDGRYCYLYSDRQHSISK